MRNGDGEQKKRGRKKTIRPGGQRSSKVALGGRRVGHAAPGAAESKPDQKKLYQKLYHRRESLYRKRRPKIGDHNFFSKFTRTTRAVTTFCPLLSADRPGFRNFWKVWMLLFPLTENLELAVDNFLRSVPPTSHSWRSVFLPTLVSQCHTSRKNTCYGLLFMVLHTTPFSDSTA